MRTNCAYGCDGSTDEQKPLSCAGSLHPDDCVVGCGDPPNWCNRSAPHDLSAEWFAGKLNDLCGLWGNPNGSPSRPWRPADLAGAGGMLDLFQRFGAVFDGTFHYSGYNEFVVETRPWLEGLPHSVEGIFYVECEDDDRRNLAFYDLLAPTCAEARERAREMHQLFLSEFRVAAEHFPLLALRPSNWHEPFVDAHQLEPSW